MLFKRKSQNAFQNHYPLTELLFLPLLFHTIIVVYIINPHYHLSFLLSIKNTQNNETETKRRKPDLLYSMITKVKARLTLMDSSAYFTLQKKQKKHNTQNPQKTVQSN